MAVGPFDVALVVARLQALVGDGQGDAVQYRVADYAANNATAIAARDIPLPAAYVLEPSYVNGSGEDGGSSMMINAYQAWEIGVLTIVKNYGGTPGNLQSEEAQKLRTALWGRLLGWAPEDQGFVLDSGRGQLLDFDDETFMYLDVFTLRRVVRQQFQP